MLFRQFFDPVSCTYTYLLADESTRDAVLIDPVFELHARDAALLRELGLNLRYTLDSHLHADHVTGAYLMKRAFGSKIVLSSKYGAENVDVGVDGGDAVKIGDTAIEVRATPGHTAGCITFVIGPKKLAFTGDALLIRGAGRTDFQEGDAHQLYRSIKEQILTLPDDCMLYPAHDYQGRTVTTVREELDFNARLGGAANENDFVGYMDNLGLAHPKRIDIAVPANQVCGRPESEEPVANWGPVVITYAGIPQIDLEWVAANRPSINLLDVRSDAELADGIVPGAICIPLDNLRARIDELPRDLPIVIVCRSGRRSGQAANILRKAGLDAASIAGGMLQWEELSLPVE